MSRAYPDEERRGRYLEPHRGQTVMILGILSLFVAPFILGPIAWVMGNADLKKMNEGLMDPSGRDNTNLGKILGMVATIISGVFLAIGLLIVLIWVGAMLCCAGGLFMVGPPTGARFPTVPRGTRPF